MAIDNMVFAIHVADQRKKLVDTLKDKGVSIESDAPLSVAIDKVKLIEKQPLNIPDKGWRVVYYDIDGTILKDEYVEDGGTPTPPTASYDSDRLTFIGWVDLPETITEPTFALATYESKNDSTYVTVNLTTTLTVTMSATISKKSENFMVDWGDGTVDTLQSHTYSEAGVYIIQITGTFSLSRRLISPSTSVTKLYFNKTVTLTGGTSSNTGIFYDCSKLEVVVMPQTYFKPGNGNDLNMLKTFYCDNMSWDPNFLARGYEIVKIGGVVTANQGVINNAYKLESLNITGGFSSSSSGALNGYNLRYVRVAGDGAGYVSGGTYASLPVYYADYISVDDTVTALLLSHSCVMPDIKFPPNLKRLSLNGLSTREEIIFPEGLTNLGSMTNLYRLKKCYIPDTLEGTMPAFTYAFNLKSLKIPSKITALSSNFLGGTEFLEELIIMPSTLLAKSSSFKVAPNCVIWVNDDVIEQYKTATNWSAHADKMRPLSEKPID